MAARYGRAGPATLGPVPDTSTGNPSTAPATPRSTSNPVSGDAVIWRDGELIPYAEATVHVLSHAAHRGSEVFDVLRVFNGAAGPMAVGLRPHVARFLRSMELMYMEVPFDVATLEEAVRLTVVANPGSSLVKLVAAWEDVAVTSRPTSFRPTVYVTAEVVPEGPALAPAARVMTSSMPKIPAEILPPSLKVAASYTAGVRRQIEADRAGYDDVIYRTITTDLAEATTQSLLVVRGDRMLAPSLDRVLDGITRRLLCELAPGLGLAVEVRDVHWDEVEGADELILTSTNSLVRPVSSLDDRPYAAPGPVADGLAAEAEKLLVGDHELSPRWLTPMST